MSTLRKQQHVLVQVAGGLGWPLLLGAAAGSVFYLMIFGGPLDTPAAHRYFASHPVSFVATGMFFVGLAALGMKFLEVMGQATAAHRIQLTPPTDGGDRVEDAPQLLAALDTLPPRLAQSYFARRLHDALEHVRRSGSADDLGEELKYLADLDATRQHESYALVRILIWATPMLGFLGTVIGITKALGDLDPNQLASAIQTAMEKLLSGLYVAFDTTALALSLSIILMFVQFLIERLESQLLTHVDDRVAKELTGRFRQLGSGRDPHVASIERMGHAVLHSTEDLVRRQAELWQESLGEAQQRWTTLAQSASEQVRSDLGASLNDSLERHARRLSDLERDAAAQGHKRWEQWQTALSENARMLQQQQAEMVRQSELLSEALKAAGEVIKLEEALNRNLQSLAGAKNFEDTVMSLSAAIHLLNTRLGGGAAPLELNRAKQSERAA